jgi:predicted ArsR family transcriptional regulator
MIEMTGEALLNAIREAQQATTAADEVGGLTAEELRDALGLSKDKLRAVLQQFAKDGRLKVGWRLMPDLTGRPNRRPTYLLTE